MKFNLKNIPIIIVLLILTSIALSACATTATTSTTGSALVETNFGLQADESIDEPALVNEEVNAEASQQMKTETAADSESISAALSEETGVNYTSVNGLSQAEVDSLVFMREEEKLAHDVYVTMYDLWGINVFQNIAGSEQTHADAVAGLLSTYNITDPADTSPLGVFINPDLQTLYDDLVAWGSQSLSDALKVGAAIEEIDILDLEEALTFVNANDIRNVYQNLLSGSENHLRAFTATLERQTGEIYEPQYMDVGDYAAIIASSIQGGAQGQGNGNQGNGRRP